MHSDAAQQASTGTSRTGERLIVYALSSPGGRVPGHAVHALSALRGHASTIVAVALAEPDDEDSAVLRSHCDSVTVVGGDGFGSRVYRDALAALGSLDEQFDEVVLTGDGWIGPVRELGPVLDGMADAEIDVWEMIESARGPVERFPDEGFPDRPAPWSWVAVRRSVLRSRAWAAFWGAATDRDAAAGGERSLVDALAAAGFRTGAAFPLGDFPTEDPGLFVPDVLVDAGCPIVGLRCFSLYPPFLDRHAVLGRSVIDRIECLGFPMELLWGALVRTVPPKALNTNASMLEILSDEEASDTSPPPMRIAAIAYITDLRGAEDVLDHLAHLPSGYDLYVTTTDGRKARALEALIEDRSAANAGLYEVRVTPSGRGRDMSDFFVGCRDVLLEGGYDLIVKVHARRMRRKTLNMQRYASRYQLDNLLGTTEYVRNLISLFERERGLGLVFPPMMHIGYALMGRGWAGYRPAAEELCTRLGIDTPLDEVSPLAPYGGMWVGRPAALRVLAEHRWTYRDYGSAGEHRYGDLAKLQERLVASSAASEGFHSRTVLTPEHVSISYSSLDYKLDAMLTSSRGYPVEQITLLHRAGWTGYGGVVALSRMYLRLYHPRIARPLAPLYRIAERVFGAVRRVRGLLRGANAHDAKGGAR